MPTNPTDNLLFPTIEAIPLSQRVIAALKDAFFEGKLKPGDPIVERKVSRQMNVGTPVIREALIALQGQGFVRRIANTGTFVTSFEEDEVRQLYGLRVELEVLALQWARTRVTQQDLQELARAVDLLVIAGENGNRRQFLERDLTFHRLYWNLSGNTFLAETLERLMAPLFAFSVLASGIPVTASMAREHYDLISALRELDEPDFTVAIRKTLGVFASRWITSMTSAETAAARHKRLSPGFSSD